MSIQREIVVIFLVSSLALSSCGPIYNALNADRSTTASLSEIAGLVEIQNPDGNAFFPAADGNVLQVDGKVRTGEDGRLRLDLPTGTFVRVGPESLLTLETNETTDNGLHTVLTLEASQAWVMLNGGSLEIRTAAGTARVLGSYMVVQIDPLTQDVKVHCLEGSCQAENTTAKTDLKTGEGSILYAPDPNGGTPPPAPQVDLLTQEDYDKFLANVPEAEPVVAEVIETIKATATAKPPVDPPPASVDPASCFQLSQPASGSEISSSESAAFDWNDQANAYKYILTLVKPNGEQTTHLAWESSLSLSSADLPVAGSYSWQVTAYDSNIQPICSAGPWTFTRPSAPPPPEAGECFHLLSPADGSELPASGEVNFTWEEQPNRLKFIFSLISPSGNELDSKIFTNSYSRNMEEHPAEGSYLWFVTAYDSNYQTICTAGPWTFTKPASPIEFTPTPGDCVTLLTPADGSAFSGAKKVDFTWTEYPGAYKYIISFKPPSSPANTFLAWEPHHVRYVESFPEGGTYRWWITVKDSNLNELCTSQSFTFSKEDTSYLYPTAPAGGDSGGGGGGGSFWGQYGPTGAQSSCVTLNFGVSTSVEGTIKLVFSYTNPTPDGNVDDHFAIGSGPGSGSLSTNNFKTHSGPVYYRYAVYNGTYVQDSAMYSFSCP